MNIKPVALAIVSVSHETDVELEILDCILPYDLDSRVVKTGIPGVIIIESRLDGRYIIDILKKCFISKARRIMPIDKIVKTDINEIVDNVISLSNIIADPCKNFRVDLKNYGKKKINKDKYIVDKIARRLKEEKGWIINLKNPEIIVFVCILNEITLLSLLKRNDIWNVKNYINSLSVTTLL
ncbi:MAG: THUMP domain-containing protein [Candidatus Methanomethylicia archaeon]|nr:THUMP domain-containing protein [Candidatus Methanomethylicia archaeon]MCX8168975.1 THUMP domain-containing protein [Candidatus Methanomethylicia archaeon]MDW7988707.1 THUMP domain-containing protein [Nitrososphaerota archaeon]